jgi:hypothetical protein
MRRAQVAKLLGAPTKIDDDKLLGSFSEWRDALELVYEGGKLVEAKLKRPLGIEYDGIELWQTKDVVKQIKARSKDWEDTGWLLNFRDLGFVLGGFGTRRIPEGKQVIVYGTPRAATYRDFLNA